MKSSLRVLCLLTCLHLTLSARAVAQNAVDQGGPGCASATVVTNLPFFDNGTLIPGDHCPGPPFNDVFYQLTASQTGNYTAGTCGSVGPTQLRIWTGGTCCSGPVIFAGASCNDDVQATFPLTTGQHVYFECGTPFSGPAATPYLFSLTGPPCSGHVQLDAANIAFPPTYVNNSAVQTVSVFNPGPGYLCVTAVTTTGHIWQAAPSSFTVPPGMAQGILLTFLPTFEHDFLGTIEIQSSDSLHPRDSIRVSGMGCRPIFTPPPPMLTDVHAPDAVYFSIPWDPQNSTVTEYAVEFSRDGFVTSYYQDYPFGTRNDPFFTTASDWAQNGIEVIGGLTPSTTYQVRLHARDATNSERVGPPAQIMTSPQIVVAPANLTLRWISGNILELNWDAAVRDTSGNPLPNQGWRIYSGLIPGDVSTPIGNSAAGTFQTDIGSSTVGFFAVEPIVTGPGFDPTPQIVWPPVNATVAGNNQVVLQDFLHSAQWDSFRIEIDSAGFPALIGSSFDNQWNLADQREALADFNNYSPGMHTITATVVDHLNRSFTASIPVNVIVEPYATFTATYATHSGGGTFTADTSQVETGGFPVTDVLWTSSTIGERYGPMISFDFLPDMDSLTLLLPEPQTGVTFLDEQDHFPRRDSANAAVVPRDSGRTATVHLTQIACCCVDLTLKTTGQSDGVYDPVGGGIGGRRHRTLGPVVECNPASNGYSVGYAFEISATLRYVLATAHVGCSWGQDAKGTRTTTLGICRNHVFTASGDPTHDYKRNNGRTYPMDSSRYGKDDYRSSAPGGQTDTGGRMNGTPTERNPQSSGVIRWRDRPGKDGTLPNNTAVHEEGQNSFLARVDPACDGTQPCCKEWDVSWDVIFCQNCSEIIQNTPPTLNNIRTPSPCPALAP